jgi:hypothetical protein
VSLGWEWSPILEWGVFGRGWSEAFSPCPLLSKLFDSVSLEHMTC